MHSCEYHIDISQIILRNPLALYSLEVALQRWGHQQAWDALHYTYNYIDVKDGMCRMVAAGDTESQTQHVQKRNSKVS